MSVIMKASISAKMPIVYKLIDQWKGWPKREADYYQQNWSAYPIHVEVILCSGLTGECLLETYLHPLPT